MFDELFGYEKQAKKEESSCNQKLSMIDDVDYMSLVDCYSAEDIDDFFNTTINIEGEE